MASADILRAARARIEDPKNWTTSAYARNAAGEKLDRDDAGAVCWCAYGALQAEGVVTCSEAGSLLRKAAREKFGTTVIIVNDCIGHSAVIDVFDAAIAAAEAEAGR